jgi:UDP-N-acetylmuramoylalanine--D-glutamate ligase
LACGASPDSMRETVRTFKGVEHRIEFVAELEGVKFYNDSKATSVDATLKALEAFSEEAGETILILGGRGKNAPYAPLKDLIETKVRKLVLIGEDADNIESQLKNYAEIVRADSMADAVEKSFQSATSGDNVLLAPACASFDMFKSFEQRGEVFKTEVQGLKSKVQSQMVA